jgi:hypothetical protein
MTFLPGSSLNPSFLSWPNLKTVLPNHAKTTVLNPAWNLVGNDMSVANSVLRGEGPN